MVDDRSTGVLQMPRQVSDAGRLRMANDCSPMLFELYKEVNASYVSGDPPPQDKVHQWVKSYYDWFSCVLNHGSMEDFDRCKDYSSLVLRFLGRHVFTSHDLDMLHNSVPDTYARELLLGLSQNQYIPFLVESDDDFSDALLRSVRSQTYNLSEHVLRKGDDSDKAIAHKLIQDVAGTAAKSTMKEAILDAIGDDPATGLFELFFESEFAAELIPMGILFSKLLSHTKIGQKMDLANPLASLLFLSITEVDPRGYAKVSR